MKKIEVLGMGCARCGQLVDLIRQKADQAGIPIDLQKITDPAQIAARGVMTTPAVSIDGKIVHKGGLPAPEDVVKWLSA